jgi:hypothetical protein
VRAVPEEQPRKVAGIEIACRGPVPRDDLVSWKGGVPMRAVGLYLLGVPVVVIVILWLFGVV